MDNIGDSFLQTLSSDFNSMQSVLSNYIVTPLNSFGIGGFVFDVEGASIGTLSAEVTDHYAEDNSFFQDNIAIRPKQFILRGFIGELTHSVDVQDLSLLQTLTQKLTTLNAVLPALSSGVQQAQSFFDGGDFSLQKITSPQFLSQANSLYAAVQNMLPQNKQQAAFQYFKALWQSKILVSLQTPFEFVSNMAITNVTAIQHEETKYRTDFSITLKEIRYASTKTTLFDVNSLISPLSSAGGVPVSNPEVPSSLPSNISALPPNGNALASQSTILNGSVQGISTPAFGFSLSGGAKAFAPWVN